MIINRVPATARIPLKLTSGREAATMLTEPSTIAIWNKASAKSKFGSRSAAWSRLASNSLALASSSFLPSPALPASRTGVPECVCPSRPRQCSRRARRPGPARFASSCGSILYHTAIRCAVVRVPTTHGQLLAQTFLISRFQQTRPQRAMHLHRRANHRLRQLIKLSGAQLSLRLLCVLRASAVNAPPISLK